MLNTLGRIEAILILIQIHPYSLVLPWTIVHADTSFFLKKYFYLTPLPNTYFVKNEKKNHYCFFPTFCFFKGWGKNIFCCCWNNLTNNKFSLKFVDFIDYLQNRRCVCGALVRTYPIQVFFLKFGGEGEGERVCGQWGETFKNDNLLFKTFS